MNTFRARLLVGSLAMATAQLAFAHAYPIFETPGAGATVSPSQQEAAINFDDGLEPAFSSIKVTDAQGKSVTKSKAVVDSTNAKHMSVQLNAPAPGVYTVAWVAIATDGHRTQGHYTFSVK
ncbi:copper resistance CopC family protein [Trinickia mobilis]|uniref:copper resistance CopC family protein n=1 Tax=Trinickia mobilis TaxID=2816356 RepID=UPI001A906CF6|nr:copper resistance protein CopC [Trinickia mobilis]